MNPKPLSCQPCPLYTLGQGFANLEGDGSSKLFVIAEALGEREAQDSLPLRPYAQAGSIFSRALNKLNIHRSTLHIGNIVNCRPPNNLLKGQTYAIGAISECRKHLTPRVLNSNPNAILALGDTALESLTGMTGRKRNISILRGYTLYSKEYGIPVIPTYHPAFIARGQKNLLTPFYHDIRIAHDVAQGIRKEGRDYVYNPTENYKHRYILNPSVDDFAALVTNALSLPHPIAYDIETTESIKTEEEEEIDSSVDKINQFQFSQSKREGIVVPFTTDFIPHIKRLMSSRHRKLSWNGWRFDDPILENALSCSIGGEKWDLMTLWHWWQADLPAGLQYAASFYQFPFPWKHYSSEHPEFYGACDVDALWYIYPQLKDACLKAGVLGKRELRLENI